MAAAPWAVFMEGLNDDLLKTVDPDRLDRIRIMAVNKVARDGRALLARDVVEQVALPKEAVSASGKRLYVAQQATGNRPEAIIRASGRPTSLARYARSPQTSERGAGATVEVSPGKARYLRKAFFIKLPQGTVLTDTQYNLGLAVRLRPGETLRNKISAVRMANGLYLLYGPSVDQVFKANDGDGLVKDRAPMLTDRLQAEVLRLLEVF
jgi:hypothetical protein